MVMFKEINITYDLTYVIKLYTCYWIGQGIIYEIKIIQKISCFEIKFKWTKLFKVRYKNIKIWT